MKWLGISITRISTVGVAISRIIGKITTGGRLVSGGILFILMFYVTADVCGRYFFRAPIKGTLEISQMMLVTIIFLTIAYTQATGGNVRIELLTARWPARAQIAMNILYSLIGMAFFTLLIIDGTNNTIEDLAGGILTDQLRIPNFPARLVIPLGGILMMLVLLVDFFRDIRHLVRRQ